MYIRSEKRPLDWFINEEMRWEARAGMMLRQAVSSTEEIGRELVKKNGPGALARGYQLEAARIAMKEEMASLWRELGLSIASSREATAAAAIDAAYDNSVLRRVPGMTDDLYERMVASERAAARRNVERALSRLQGQGYVPLSDRVYKSMALVTGRVDRTINIALAQGMSARELANAVKALIDPRVRGGVSYAAMRLGRTENNNSFHAMQVQYAQETPWVQGVKWQLSGSHPENDICDTYANQVFEPKGVPGKPHPNCLCYTTYDVMPFAQMMKDPASQEHISRLMRQAGYDENFIALGVA